MKQMLFLLLVVFFMNNMSFTQDMNQYRALVDEAWAAYEAEYYQLSANKYKEAFDVLEGKAYPNDRYNAACSFALAGDDETAIFHLTRLAEGKSNYMNYDHITTDSDLNSLHDDERWPKIIAKVKANLDEYEKDFDKPLVAELKEIYRLDQTYRKQVGQIEEEYGRASDEMREHWALINRTDSLNLIKVKKILDERGWLGPTIIGRQGNSTLFLVIQHADIETQVEYLPMMREAVKEGNARASSLALLEDRVALRQGNRQIYGSQIGRDAETGEFYVSPLIEPEKVNERRAEVGLGTIEEYIKNWDMTWDVEAHKKRTAMLEAKEKKE